MKQAFKDGWNAAVLGDPCEEWYSEYPDIFWNGYHAALREAQAQKVEVTYLQLI